MLKIDMHSHILPRQWPDVNAKFHTSGFPTIHHDTGRGDGRAEIHRDGAFFRAVDPFSWDIDERIAAYDAMGIQVQVVSTVPVMFSYGAEAEHAHYLHAYLNDHIAGLCRDHPRHVLGLGTVPLQDPDRAVRELERCVGELGLCGVQIGSHVNDWNLEAAELDPFFAAAADTGAAILVHPWDMMGTESMGKYWLPWLVGMPAEQSRAICSMIFGGVFERHPKLKVLFAHGGGSFPFTVGRIEHGYRMRPDLVAVDNPHRGPRESLDAFYLDTCVHDPKALAYLLDLMGPERLALGTDYPFPLGEQRPGSGIDALDLDQATRARLYAGTALEWLGVAAERLTA